MSDTIQDFLIEIGTEELPPKDLNNLMLDFTDHIIAGLNKEQISFSAHKSFATPRRLAVIISDMANKQPDKILERKGPSLKSAYDDKNKPTPAALGFAKSCNVDFSKLEKLETSKDSWLFYKQKITGKKTIDILPSIISYAMKNLHVKRKMKWSSINEYFVRPVHWIVAMLGKEVIPFEIFNIKASNFTLGHRFLSNTPIQITNIKDYENILETQGHVIPCFKKRQLYIKTELINACKKINCTPLIHEWLLDEVTALVEIPNILKANFSREFLKLPAEVLISSIEEHQRCFPIKDKNNQLTENFLITSNLKSKDPKTIILGNEKVMHARLKDAAFYYEVDQKTKLTDNIDKLKNVIFQYQLGSLYDKSQRISNIAQIIAEKLNVDKTKTKEASLLSKTDLLTNMVIEFPELQGHMGYYYAKLQNIDTDIAHAIKDHYMPYNAKSELPKTNLGICLSIADKIDTLVGLFGINKPPSGQADPFALRRRALGVLRILVEKEIEVDLVQLLQFAFDEYEKTLSKPLPNKNAVADSFNFCMERLKHWYHQHQITPNVYMSIASINITNILDFSRRIKAVNEFIHHKHAESLTQSNKRVKNILEKQANSKEINGLVNENILQDKTEIELYKKIKDVANINKILIQDRNYKDVLKNLSQLESTLEQFFNDVMVMHDDHKIKLNRLNLLQLVRDNFLKVADISLL